ncbi:phosphoglycerate mutase [Scheffersomyces coipomensis]|uniref:phosphoglycerate mutase n=1 Tax=Scheffersomyces coipomensis TaxID=1788519 RepID=UPI00315D3B5D
MATNPSKLDIFDSQISSNDRTEYQQRVDQFNSTLNEYWTFEVVPNVFKQSLSNTDETTFDYLKDNFGILKGWDEIIDHLKELNSKASSHETYKLLFLSRHGQGYHNLGHSKYGNEDWDDHWSKLNGDGEIVWGPDPLLTELGQNQAKENNKFWKSQLINNSKKDENLIKPTRFFASPLSRSIDTLIGTWDDIVKIEEIKPLIQENLRETIGIHTCDKRSPKSIISKKYEPKGFIIEPGFEEEDIYFKTDYRESVAEHALRIYKQFQYLFNEVKHDDIISLTTHSGTIKAQLMALGHRSFAVGTGGIVPVFVKATKITN